MATRTARQTPAGARPNRRREAVLFDRDAAGRLLENAGDRIPREMTVRSLLRFDRTRLTGRGNPPLPSTMQHGVATSRHRTLSGCAFLAACRGGGDPEPGAHQAGGGKRSPCPHRARTGRGRIALRAATGVRRRPAGRDRDSRRHHPQIDTVSAHAEIAFTAAPTAGSVNGSVRRSSCRAPDASRRRPRDLRSHSPFARSIWRRGPQLDFTVPRDTAGCSSLALAVAQSLRDLWFRPPDTPARRDHMAGLVVVRGVSRRHSAPHRRATARSRHRQRRATVTVCCLPFPARSRTVIEGTGAQFGEAVGVSGTGSGQLVYYARP